MHTALSTHWEDCSPAIVNHPKTDEELTSLKRHHAAISAESFSTGSLIDRKTVVTRYSATAGTSRWRCQPRLDFMMKSTQSKERLHG
jgi:hypothetical protein